MAADSARSLVPRRRDPDALIAAGKERGAPLRTVWTSGCEHDEPGSRCTVLDPFAGSGTTGLVAARHGRAFIGAELSSRYARMARTRIREAVPERGLATRRG